MTITKDQLAAVVVFILNGVAGAAFGGFAASPLAAGIWVLVLSTPGLFIIWCRDVLAFSGPSTGYMRPSSPGIVAGLGWVYLVAIPLFFVYQALQTV
jgi:hypothetical protein